MFKQLAIIGPTASGKSDLAIRIAHKIDAYILSIDSLSIYTEIDIISAKPSMSERDSVKHFGIDVLRPNEYFNVDIFINLYHTVVEICKKDNKNLIIIGGTSFYLKSLMQGLSKIPKIDEQTTKAVKLKLKNLSQCYDILNSVDPLYMKNINATDRYRIEKALLIYEASNLTPTQWFQQNPPKAVIENIDIFNIEVDREVLRKRIYQRTAKMYKMGLIDEITYLEQRYSRLPNAMGAIGIVEVLEYLDGKVTLQKMLENISLHTVQLAKRQQTFNRTQFKNIVNAPLQELEEIIL
ncbi:MAG: tRNA (adenosine(37)-N6)-dimethylallyltransferase MiaA [Campylobacterota bacterium]|nr:tRNA (adenosine(37)-N6)-dimethylallyltransferase MiaA [Campylobacterota bacterium]